MMDPSITLFGKRIQVNGEGEESPRSVSDYACSNFDDHHDEAEYKELAEEDSMETDQSDDPSEAAKEESTNPPAMSETDDQNEKATDDQQDSESQKDEKESNDANNSDQKQLKKPDKILPCPRCNSMDTKFCYYNNYNVNQPRHFCKSCQRYWTAGGTMRNVPVGAGRRKNKSSTSRYCHITVSEALQAAKLDITNGVHQSALKSNGTVLTFGSDNPLCESMTSVLSIADKKALNGSTRNGFHNMDHVGPIPCRVIENGDDHSSGSTVTTTSNVEDRHKDHQQPPNKHLNGFTNQMPYFQWPYMWNPAVPVPPQFCPSAFPMSFYPPPYWNGTAIPWNVPWTPPCSPSQKSTASNPNSPTLGKHSRDGEINTRNDNEKSARTTTVLVPKTLRIDDPDEAAKSSIWSTLGIKKDKSDPMSKGFFNSFQSKEAQKKDQDLQVPSVLKANPAALCRSFSFQERA